MISSFFNTFIHTPLYNALIFLINHVPLADVGIAVILLTVLVKLLLFPLARNASLMQMKMRAIAPELEKIKEKYKDDRQKQTLETLELYKKHNIKPFASILVLFIQIPVILGLYWIFYKGGLPKIDTATLYPFVHSTVTPNMHFLGLVDMAGKSALFAFFAGLTQYFMSSITLPKPAPKSDNPTMKEDFAHSMHIQMKYVMPIFIAVIAYSISAAIALYWTVSNLFSIAQELFIRRNYQNK